MSQIVLGVNTGEEGGLAEFNEDEAGKREGTFKEKAGKLVEIYKHNSFFLQIAHLHVI